MLFDDNLHNILKDIYHIVTKLGYSAEYVEELPPAERELIINYYLEEQKEKRDRQNPQNNGMSIGSGIDTTG